MSGWPVIDSIQFARQAGKMNCSVAVSECRRLADAVADSAGELKVDLAGFLDTNNTPCLQLHVEGAVALVCQRCLEPLTLQVVSDRKFVLAQREADLVDVADEADDIESLLADDHLDVRTLVEDEVLLQVPIAPMHAQGECEPPPWSGDQGQADTTFAALGALNKIAR